MAKKPIEVKTITHKGARRRNIPTAEYESVMAAAEKSPVRLAYERRNRDLDPQLVWRGKEEQDWSDLIVQAPPLYIQEKVHPKAIIDDLQKETKRRKDEKAPRAPDLFGDFNGIPVEARTEFYAHNQHWSNRMIAGDSLSVMASLAEREGLRGQVQCVYLDPPYGIKFNSNFQWSTSSRDVKDGARDHMSREPEQVRAFRDTWRDGIHSYLTYLRDRLTVARDLLHESGSIFVQIGDENVHRVRALMDEVFGEENYVSQIDFKKTAGLASDFLATSKDHILYYVRNRQAAKFRRQFLLKEAGQEGATQFTWAESEDGTRRKSLRSDEGAPEGWRLISHDNLTSTGFATTTGYPLNIFGKTLTLKQANQRWKTTLDGMARLKAADRVMLLGSTPRYVRKIDDFPVFPVTDVWSDTGVSGFADPRVYVVQTSTKVVERCLLMATDPGDLVLDPSCGSGTTAYVAEQWGRRWITIDTSRVAVALARSRLMGARYHYYLLADSPEGQRKEAEVTRGVPKSTPTRGDVRHGFVYERVPHITLKSIANNVEIDTIWEAAQQGLGSLLAELNELLDKGWEEWEVPHEAGEPWDKASREAHAVASSPARPEEERRRALAVIERNTGRNFSLATLPARPIDPWETKPAEVHAKWWAARVARQKAIDASIAAKAEFEFLYDKPHADSSRTRVAGPFTVESLSPHRTLAVDWDDELIDMLDAAEGKRAAPEGIGRHEAVADFAQMILENLKVAGVQQAHKEDRITFSSVVGWPGNFVCAEGTFMEGNAEKRAGIFIGPEFGTVSRPDLVAAAREAGDAGFDVLVACAFNYDAHSSEFTKLGRVPVLKARMNPDLHMGADLKATGAGNLFVIFGEPDVRIHDQGDGTITVQVFGVDVFKPQTGEVESEGTDGIALWMLDTDYNEESFFVRHAYFLGANDPYKALKTTLKAEIDEEAWESLHSDTSRPFPKPASKRIAVKVINHLGDEVMKVFKVE